MWKFIQASDREVSKVKVMENIMKTKCNTYYFITYIHKEQTWKFIYNYWDDGSILIIYKWHTNRYKIIDTAKTI